MAGDSLVLPFMARLPSPGLYFPRTALALQTPTSIMHDHVGKRDRVTFLSLRIWGPQAHFVTLSSQIAMINALDGLEYGLASY